MSPVEEVLHCREKQAWVEKEMEGNLGLVDSKLDESFETYVSVSYSELSGASNEEKPQDLANRK